MRIGINKPEAIPLVVRMTGDSLKTDLAASVCQIEDDGTISAAVLFNNHRDGKIEGTIAVADGFRLRRKFIACIFHLPMVRMNTQTIVARVRVSNIKSRKLVEQMGFECKTIKRGGHPSGEDLAIYEIDRGICKWIPLARRYGIGD